VLLTADAGGGVAAGVGAAAVVARGAVAGGDDELHAESVAARASADAGAMNMVSFKSFFPSSFFARPLRRAFFLHVLPGDDSDVMSAATASTQACQAGGN